LWIEGKYWNAQIVYFDGIIDEIRSYDRSLSTKEVQILYDLDASI
jgi:hypothetical protein